MTDSFNALWTRANQNNADAQYELAHYYFQQKSISRGMRWLKKAVQQKHPDALETLGFWYSIGRYVDTDFSQAIKLLTDAAEQQKPGACYRLAECWYLGLGGKIDEISAKTYLIKAATLGHPNALLTLAMGYACKKNDAAAQQKANQCLQACAKMGEPLGGWLWARRCLLGIGGDIDLKQAYYWYQVGLGHPLSSGLAKLCQFLDEPFDAAFMALDPATKHTIEQSVAQLANRPKPQPLTHLEAVLTDFQWPDFTASPPKCHCQEPWIVEYHDVFSLEECWYLRWQSAPYLRPSDTVNPATGENLATSIRTSYSMFFTSTLATIVIRWFEHRMAQLTGLPIDQGEALQVLHYEPGQEYKPHYDYFDPQVAGMQTPLKLAGQRLMTCLSYLNTVQEGGQTHFPRLNLTIPAQLGQVLIYRNSDEQGQLFDKTLHAGLPVKKGFKWLASKWICERETPYGRGR